MIWGISELILAVGNRNIADPLPGSGSKVALIRQQPADAITSLF
jgi:hypothetical protein